MKIVDPELMKKAVTVYGSDAQLFMVVEEVSELIHALSKWRREGSLLQNKYRNWVVEELADVLIMLNQLIYMFNINDEELDNMLDKKTKILKERLDKHDIL